MALGFGFKSQHTLAIIFMSRKLLAALAAKIGRAAPFLTGKLLRRPFCPNRSVKITQENYQRFVKTGLDCPIYAI
jgi:hypothetical protein